MFSSIIDQIPWWVYLGLMFISAGLLWYFAAPIILPLWKLAPNWLKVTLGVVVAIFLAFIKGRNLGHDNAVKEQEKRNAEGETKRSELHDKIRKLPPSDVDNRLSKWMRD